MLRANFFQIEARSVQPPVHVVDIGHVTLRPKSFRNRRTIGPHARIDILFRSQFGPHVHLAAKNMRRLSRIEIGPYRKRVRRVVFRGALHLVEVVRRGENAVEAQLRRSCKGFHTLPGLDNYILTKIGPQNFIPSHHPPSMLLQNLHQPVVEVGLQRIVVFQLVAFHERLD
jgi:hypothetical protein